MGNRQRTEHSEIYRLTPLTRLSLAYEIELEIINDAVIESDLAIKYRERVTEAASRRDAVFKGLVAIDGILAIAASGKSFSIPGTDLKLADVPALLEVLTGFSSLAAVISISSFMTWLCYSQILYVFAKRRARKSFVDPDLWNLAEVHSEPINKILRSNLNLSGADWHQPGWGFKTFATANSLATALFFIALPVLHCSLIYMASEKIIMNTPIDWVHIVFFAWIAVSHVLAAALWVSPMKSFSFTSISRP